MQTLRDKAYAYIRGQLISGELTVGTKISVQSVASSLGISRQPVAEAFRKLEVEKVVEQHARRGTIIRQPLSGEIAELYEIRELMECHAIARAATRLSATEFEKLRQLVSQLRALCIELRHPDNATATREQVRSYLAGDLAFHNLLVAASGNRRLTKIVEDVQVFSRIFGSARTERVTFADVVVTYAYHGRIYGALRRRDAAAAERVLQRHIQRSRDHSLAHLIEQEVKEATQSA